MKKLIVAILFVLLGYGQARAQWMDNTVGGDPTINNPGPTAAPTGGAIPGATINNPGAIIDNPIMHQRVKEAVGRAMEPSYQYDASELAKHIKSNIEERSFEEHPWRDGRDIKYSGGDWSADSTVAILGPAGVAKDIEAPKKPTQKELLANPNLQYNPKAAPAREASRAGWQMFHECFEPRLKRQNCEYCQPKIVYPFNDCMPRRNPGEIWEYWWPEWEIDVNNFGVSAVNPEPIELFNRPDLSTKSLIKRKDSSFYPEYEKNVTETNRALDMEGKSSNIEDVYQGPLAKLGKGQTHTGGISPLDQCQTFEAHIYRPKVTASNYTWPKSRAGHGADGCWFYRCRKGCCSRPYWWNGYIWKNNIPCFLDSLPDKPVKNGDLEKKFRPVAWSEEYPEYARFWRQPIMTQFVNKDKYKRGEHPDFSGIPGMGDFKFEVTTQEMMAAQGKYFGGTAAALPMINKCLKCRHEIWSNMAGVPDPLFGNISGKVGGEELFNNAIPQSPLAGLFGQGKVDKGDCEFCYYHGSILWTPTNTVCGFHHPLTSATVAARRFLELVQEMREKYPTQYNWPRHNIPYVPHVGLPLFTDFFGKDPSARKMYIDKLQLVYPKVSRCFRMNPSDKGEMKSKDVTFESSSQSSSSASSTPYMYNQLSSGFSSSSSSSESQDSGIDVPWVWEQNHAEFPADLMQSWHLGSVRLMFWNRRTACSCQYRSIIEDNLPIKKKGWGCQAYNAFGSNPWRDQGDEFPTKDKLYGTVRKGFPADFPYACSAYQIYPFVGTVNRANRAKCEAIWGPVGSDRGCGKNSNPPRQPSKKKNPNDPLMDMLNMVIQQQGGQPMINWGSIGGLDGGGNAGGNTGGWQ
ncbi:MAG: hypothetical protein IT292_04670 [Deltaproteobacteria bacterium]|nr:hypothetical protein [Deltaproteobacteria bacterium]